MNAFELISLNKGLNLDNLFDSDKVREFSVASVFVMNHFKILYILSSTIFIRYMESHRVVAMS